MEKLRIPWNRLVAEKGSLLVSELILHQVIS